jgi:GAF domain-containing protein
MSKVEIEVPDLRRRNVNGNLIHALHDDARESVAIAATHQSASTPAATADEVVDYTRAQLDADHASISVFRSRQRLETIGPTDQLAARLDQMQYELREGPCYDNAWHAHTLSSSNLSDDGRWPRWGARAAALGVTSLLAVELSAVDDQHLGSINVYWRESRRCTPDDVALLSIFARRAGLALAEAWNDDSICVALDTRKLIGQAQGILMERYDLDEAKAFEVLRRYSQHHNIRLRDVATYLKATQQLPS